MPPWLRNAQSPPTAQSNPIDVAYKITIPCLVANADDDPICTKANVDDHAQHMLNTGAERCVLMEVPAGGHCAFATGLRAERWLERLGARFLAEFAERSLSQPML